MSYPGHSLGGSYPSAEVQLVYSKVPTSDAENPNPINKKNISKVSDRSREWPEGSLFNSYNTEMLHFTLDTYFTLLSAKQGVIKFHF